MTRKVILHCRGAEAFDEATRDLGLTLRGDTIQLSPRVCVADEMGRCNSRDVEHTTTRVHAKKIFELDDPGPGGATLGVLLQPQKEEGTLLVDINGHTVQVAYPRERDYWENGWRRVPVEPGALKRGTNEVVLRTAEGSAFQVFIENCVHPNRSAKSRDGGRTWQFGRLGHNGAYRGEYVVRLELKRYASEGVLTSPPIDLARAFARKAIGARVELQKVGLRAEADKPKGTDLVLEYRFSAQPYPDSPDWSAWKRAREETDEALQDARFVQWRARLATRDPQATPALRRVSLSLTGEVWETGGPRPRRVEESNPPILRSSYHFAHQRADDARTGILRKRWKLDEVVAGAESELQKFVLLRQWVRSQWEDGWNRGPLDFVPHWDTLAILELTRRQLTLGMCTHYATVMTHCCTALGLTARTQIMQAHCINEVWSNEFRKWVAMDVGGDTDDSRKTTYHLERDGVPLSALEAHQAWVSKDLAGIDFAPESAGEAFKLEDRLKLFDRFMIHLRNDELTSLEPGEPEHGVLPYHYNGYLFWEDDDTPPLPWFSLSTRRAADLYWSVNRTHIHLREGAAAGELEVLLEHCMPNFAEFEAQMNGGEWAPTPAEFTWRLAEGTNRLSARAVNAYGLPGPESEVRLALPSK